MASTDVIQFSRTDSYSSYMAEELMALKKENLLMNFTIIIKEESLPCHKLVLAIHSPYMKAMLTSDMQETAKQVVTLDHLNLEAMKVVLSYMYSGKVSMPSSHLMDVIQTCDYLQMSELKEQCLDRVPSVLRPANVISWYQVAKMMDLENVMNNCLSMMVTSFEEISKHSELLAFTYAQVEELFSDVIIKGVNNDDVLMAAMQWINHSAKVGKSIC